MISSNAGAAPSARLLNEREVAKMAAVSTSWLQKMRLTGSGPKYFKLGKTVRYAESDVLAWLDSLRAV